MMGAPAKKNTKKKVGRRFFLVFFCSGAIAVHFFTAYGNKIVFCSSDRREKLSLYCQNIVGDNNMHNRTCFNYHSETGILMCFEYVLLHFCYFLYLKRDQN